MSKEFIVNGRKLAKVECDVSADSCPVIERLRAMEKAANPVIGTAVDKKTSKTNVFVATMGNVADLKKEMLDLCFDCNVKAR